VSLDQPIPLLDFAIALFIGALVGIEREKKLEEEEADARAGGARAGDPAAGFRRGIGGLRTFILFAETGAVSAWLSVKNDTPWIFVGAGALVTAIVIAGHVAYTRQARAHFGLTTEVAAIVVYLLGGTVLFGYAELAVALAIATSAVLAFKQPLHGVVERIGREDLYAGLKLLIAIFIVLPVLPDRTVDPWGALNPWQMGWLVVLISSLSLAGYVATRWLGPGRGIALTGLLGGLVSSTAVTLALARRSRERDGARLSDSLAAGVLASWAVMFVRMGVITAAIDGALARALAPPLALLTALCVAAVWWHHRRGQTAAHSEVPLRNPFSLTAAVRFALLFAAVLLVVHIVERHATANGLYLVAALAGLTDVDAITLSMAGAARDGTTALGVAGGAIVVAALANTLTKFGIVAALGERSLRRPLAIASGALAVVGGAVVLWLR